MLAIPVQRSKLSPAWHQPFLQLLPEVKYWLNRTFRYLRPEARAEAIQDFLVKVVIAFARLHQRGKAYLAYAYSLAHYAAAQTRKGRRAGTKMNVNDVASAYCHLTQLT